MARQLKDVLEHVAKKAERENKFAKNEELAQANKAAVKLFESPDPIYRRTVPGEPPKNITFIALWRVDRYCRRRGINWRLLDWETLVAWLYENWDKILRVLLSLLPLVLL